MADHPIFERPVSRRRLGALGLGAAGLAALGGARPAVDRAAAQDATTVTFWGEWTGEGELQVRTMVDAFNAAQTAVRVEYVVQQDMVTKFLTAATSGQVPDLMIWDRWQTANYAPRNVLHAIDERITTDGIDRAQFYDQAMLELTNSDKLYGLPLTVDARALFYNKAHLQAAGLQPPATWDELAAAAMAMTVRDGGGALTRSGFSLGDVGLFSMYLHQAGGNVLNEDNSATAFNDDKGIAVLNYWKSMMDAGVYEVGYDTGLTEGQDAFVTGKVSMLYTGPWMISTYQKYGTDLDFGVVPPVAGPNGDKGAGVGGFGLVIPEGSKNKDAAWAFMRWWMADVTNATTWGTTSRNIPGNRTAAQDPAFTGDEYIAPIVATIDFGTTRPAVAGYAPMETDALIPNLQLFMEGSQSAEDTLGKAQEDGDRVLQENS